MKSSARGFSLIELMITMVLVAILVAVALPTYRDHIRKSRRAEAQAFLMAVAAREQQFLIDARSYTAVLANIGLSTPDNVAAAYTIALTAAAGPPPTFTVTATPKSEQASEKCGTLSLNQTGAKTAAVAGCW